MRVSALVGLVGFLAAGLLLLTGCDDGGGRDPDADAAAVPTCDDGVFNGDEIDTDCGGPTCEPCDAGKACASDADCVSRICDDTNTCQRARCNDEIQNGTETDVDCGGDDCLPCTAGGGCETGADCLSRSCSDTEGICIDPCIDGVISAGERGPDCGGVCIAACPPGTGCLGASDCDSGVCDGLICAEPACDDTVVNGDESDLDCGGEDCDGCAPGRACRTGADCASQVCQEDGTCAEPTCDDGFQNGEETDLDCGGQACEPCPDGSMCRIGSDCESKVCDPDTRICQEPTCDDGVNNGDESDIDCGGADCDGCADGAACRDASDCVADSCFFGGCGRPRLTEFGRDEGYVGSEYDNWPGQVCPDVASTGTGLSVGPAGRARVDIPFEFRFYGRDVDELFVHADGIISFDDTSITATSTTRFCPPYNETFWTLRVPAEAIMAYWERLNPDRSGTVAWEVVGTAPNRRLAIVWESVRHDFGLSSDVDVTFRVVLDEGSDTIHLCYLDTDIDRTTWSQGQRAVSGINRGNGIDGEGITYGCWNSIISGTNLLYESTGALDPPDMPE